MGHTFTALLVAIAATLLGFTPAAQAQSTYEWEPRAGGDRVVCIRSEKINDRAWSIGRARRQWNRALPARSVKLRRDCKRSERIRIDSANRPDRMDKSAWATFGVSSSGWIKDADVLFNRAVVRQMPRRDCFRAFLAVHEIGHALGLPHSDDPHSVMTGGVWPEGNCGKVTRSDRRAIRNLYR